VARKANPEGITRTQVLFPTPDKVWLETEAYQRDTASKSNGGRSVKVSHLVTNAIEFYRANTALVDAWIRDRAAIEPPSKRELSAAVRFCSGNRTPSNPHEKPPNADTRS
jgi:hypothetical protein